ncbi:hypothetical protein LAZ67_20000097 [Cordylochernes scorpioides]|uniref:Uncharacterized protein n=1 Tax=Cordylochernes scorpioides TaxID=51811 RepID=A0ABY6LIV7_9ARAC|nr:hypothetical protein LAZ67_20000097 [Cordylochernes scorpioides]
MVHRFVLLAVTLSVAAANDPAPDKKASKREELVDVSASSSNPVYSAPGYDSPGGYDPPGYKSAPGSGNMYYYYYPMHDKNEDNGYAGSSSQVYASGPPPGGFQGSAEGSYEPQESSYGGYPPSYGGPSYAPPPSYGGPSGPAYPSYPGPPPPPPPPSPYMPPPPPAYGPSYAGSAPIANYGPPLPYAGHYSVPYQPVASASGPPASSQKKYGLGSLIMPMLALAGLGLLIPSVSNVKGRKKRDVEDYRERLDRYLAMYKQATSDDQCMSKVVCELGTSIAHVQGKAAVFRFLKLVRTMMIANNDVVRSILEQVVPDWMKSKLGVMKSAVTQSETGKCTKFKC